MKTTRRLTLRMLLALTLLGACPPLRAEESPTADAKNSTVDNSASDNSAASEAAEDGEHDGDRDWGRDDGIAVSLSTTSKLVVGVSFLGLLAVVGWMVAYRKPDGAVHPYDEEST